MLMSATKSAPAAGNEPKGGFQTPFVEAGKLEQSFWHFAQGLPAFEQVAGSP